MIVELFSLHFSINVMNWIGNLDWRTKRSREELPHIWGQGQKLGGPHAQWAAAKRSYPTSEVRGSGRECQAVTVQERLRGATPCPRPRAAAERSHPASTTKARDGGQEDPPHLWGQGRWREEQPHVQLFATPWTVACQAPLSREFSRQEYWSGSQSLRQGIFLTQGLNPVLLHCRQIPYHLRHQGSPCRN